MKHCKLEIIGAMLLTLTLTGCFFSSAPVRETRIYDLTAETSPAPAKCIFTLMLNESPARQKMFYRRANGIVQQDPYNCWVQSPELMLQRYFRNRFANISTSNPDKLIKVRGTVRTFELDLPRNQALLQMGYELICGTASAVGSINVSVPCPEKTPEAFARAMNSAAGAAANQIDAAVKKFAAENKLP